MCDLFDLDDEYDDKEDLDDTEVAKPKKSNWLNVCNDLDEGIDGDDDFAGIFSDPDEDESVSLSGLADEVNGPDEEEPEVDSDDDGPIFDDEFWENFRLDDYGDPDEIEPPRRPCFVVIEELKVDVFVKKVNEKLEEGYKLHGDMKICSYGGANANCGYAVHCQALVLD